MLTSENPVDGALTITADVPDNTELPPVGYFAEITVHNWHGIRCSDSRVMSDATIPAFIEMTMADGSRLALWPDGTFVVYAVPGSDAPSWSLKITKDGVVPNPYRR